MVSIILSLVCPLCISSEIEFRYVGFFGETGAKSRDGISPSNRRMESRVPLGSADKVARLDKLASGELGSNRDRFSSSKVRGIIPGT